jgi:hypothetical protein
MPDANEEMLALLREIRDLQKRHFERYVKFTDDISAAQARSEELRQEEAERATQDTAEALAEQRAMGRIVRRAEWMTPVMAILMGITIFAVLSQLVLRQIVLK